jgi:hypothetical protein
MANWLTTNPQAVEAGEWSERLIALSVSHPPEERAMALLAGGELCLTLGQNARGREILLESSNLWRGLHRPRELACARMLLTYVLAVQSVSGQYDPEDDALGVGQEAVDLMRSVGDRWGVACALTALGAVVGVLSNAREGEALCRQARPFDNICTIAW